MLTNSQPLDLLIVDINTGKAALMMGRGKLIANQNIASTLTQVLSLFSERVVQEPLSFVNFAEHVMFFGGTSRYRAVTIAPSYVNLVEVNKRFRLILNILDFHLTRTGKDLNPAIGKDLYGFFATINIPAKGLYLVNRSPDAFLAYLVFLSGLIRDLKSAEIEEIIQNTFFFKPMELNQIQNLIEEKEAKSIIAVGYTKDNFPELGHFPLCVFSTEDSLSVPFPTLPDEKLINSISRIFGEDSHAFETAKALSSSEAMEVAKTVQIIPAEHDHIVREATLNAIQSPTSDIIISLSETFLTFMRNYAKSKPAPTPTPVAEPEPIPTPTPIEQPIPKPSLEPIPAPTPIAEEPPAPEPIVVPQPTPIPEPTSVPSPKLVVETPIEDIPPPVAVEPSTLELSEYDYDFGLGPIVLITKEFVTQTPSQSYSYRGEIEIRVGAPKGQIVDIIVVLPPGRAKNFYEEVKSNLEGLPGEISVQADSIIIPVPMNKLMKYIRSVSWQAITEYLMEIQDGIAKKSEAFTFPEKGSIMLIAPDRDYVREKLPRQIKDIKMEKDIRSEIQTDQPWTAGASVDQIIMDLVKYLKRGDGIAFIPHPEENEMSEIILFLLLTSEIMGVAFSRW